MLQLGMTGHGQRGSNAVPIRDRVQLVIVAAILLCFALQAWLALVMEINWDEFFYLSNLYSYERGELTKPLQSFQVHLLAWLTHLPGDEIDQVIAGRLFMLMCEAGSSLMIFRLARAFVDRKAAMFAVLAYVSAGFTIVHGGSFRADPVATVLGMAALAALARGRTSAVGALAVALPLAVGLLITIKLVLYAPAFAGIAAWRITEAQSRRPTIPWIAATAALTVALTLLFYGMHLLAIPQASLSGSHEILESAGRATLLDSGLFPRAAEIGRAALLSPLQSILLAAGCVGGAAQFLRRANPDRLAAAAVLACAAPLLALAFYRNAFPYFFAFILPPAMPLLAWQATRMGLLDRLGFLSAALLIVPAALVAVEWSNHDQHAQRQLVTQVHRIAPTPVPYIDRNGMIASYPKRGFFMSTWGMQSYRRAGRPMFGELLARGTIPLLIVNGPALQNAMGEFDALPRELSLLAGDKAVLRANYVHHWGPLWVAGKTFAGRPEGTPFEIAIPGTYTVEGADISVDRRFVKAGEVVGLSRGPHVVLAPAGTLVTLRWGDHLRRPAQSFAGPVYRGL